MALTNDAEQLAQPVKIGLLPNGWAIRRVDGTIAGIEPVQDLNYTAALLAARQRAKTMDLSPLPAFQHKKAKLSAPPKAQLASRHRFRGVHLPEAEQWSIYLSLQLSLSTLGAQGKRRQRWAKMSVGELGKLDGDRVTKAWRRIYGLWAWSTSLKATHTPEQVFSMDLPVDTDAYLDLIQPPPAPSIEQIWERLGFDYVTGRDTVARQKERLAVRNAADRKYAFNEGRRT